MTTVELAPRRDRQPSIAFPLILISIGALFLLANLGYLVGVRWSELFRLWPLLLVIAGVDIVLRRRSWIAAAIADVALIGAAVVYVVTAPLSAAGATLSYATDVPRGDTTDLSVTLNYGAGTVHVAGGASELVSVRSSQQDVVRTVTQSGGTTRVTMSSGSNGTFTWDGRDRTWNVDLPSDVRTALTLNVGAGSYDADLTNVQLTRATLNGGASGFTMRLPQPKGDVPITISIGMASLDLEIPAGVPYRIRQTGFPRSMSGATSTNDYASATDRFTIEISGGMTSVTVR